MLCSVLGSSEQEKHEASGAGPTEAVEMKGLEHFPAEERLRGCWGCLAERGPHPRVGAYAGRGQGMEQALRGAASRTRSKVQNPTHRSST